jgi:phenylacetate-CoA ligase
MAGGQLIVPVARRKPPFWVWNSALRQLYLSSYHLGLQNLGAYLNAMHRYSVRFLVGYSSSLTALASSALRLGATDMKLAVAVACAEPLFDYQREAIGRAFGCPVRATYGMCEEVATASECGAGNMHLWPEIGWVETWRDGRPAAAGSPGELVCTSLLHHEMPLIRYRVGDVATLEEPDTACSCGRTLPIVREVAGRTDDILYTRDGRAVGRLDPVFKADLPIVEAQIAQETLRRVRILCVPQNGFDAATKRSIAQRLRDRMGDVEVVVEETAEIPRGPNGKFRAVVCRLSPEERRAVTGI